jgi:hypothetical protein
MKFIERKINPMASNLKWSIVLLGILLTAWSVFIPVFEGPDESGHYCHAEYIARNRRLPNFNVRDGCFLAYPPGYYALVAPLIAVRPTVNFDDEQIQPNPEYISNRKSKDVFAKYIHPPSELIFQWNPLLQTVHLIRLVSVLLGLGIIGLTVKAAKLADKFRWLPYFSVILFFNPMFLHMFSVISNVVLVSFLAAVFIYLHLKQEASGSCGKLALRQGIVLGLGAITKINMLSLAGGYLFTLLISNWKWRQKLKHLMFVVTGFITTTGWYIWRTLRLYGEPFEVNIASSLRGASMTRMQEMGVINYWSSFPDTLFRTFWSGYGLNKVWLPDLVVVGLLIMTLFVCVGFFSSYRKLPRLAKISWYYVVAVLLGHVLINIKTEAFNAKDIFTAYLPLSLILSFGAKKFVADVKNNCFLTKKGSLIIFGLSVLFYAKFEIVRLIKLALTGIGLTSGFAAESISLPSVLLHFTGKVTVILGLILIIRHQGQVYRKSKVRWGIGVGVLTILNILMLGWTSSLLYSEFL